MMYCGSKSFIVGFVSLYIHRIMAELKDFTVTRTLCLIFFVYRKPLTFLTMLYPKIKTAVLGFGEQKFFMVLLTSLLFIVLSLVLCFVSLLVLPLMALFLLLLALLFLILFLYLRIIFLVLLYQQDYYCY